MLWASWLFLFFFTRSGAKIGGYRLHILKKTKEARIQRHTLLLVLQPPERIGGPPIMILYLKHNSIRGAPIQCATIET